MTGNELPPPEEIIGIYLTCYVDAIALALGGATDDKLEGVPGVVASFSLNGREACGYLGEKLKDLEPKYNHESGALIEIAGGYVGFHSKDTVKFSEISGIPLTESNMVALVKPGSLRFVTRDEAEAIHAQFSVWQIKDAKEHFHIKD